VDSLFELLGRITNLLQPLLQQSELSLALLSMVAVAGLVAGVTPFGLSMVVLVTGRVGGAATDGRVAPTNAMRHALWFSLGAATSLFAVGLVAAAAGAVLLDYRLARYIPVLTLLMGLQLLAAGSGWRPLSRIGLRRPAPARTARPGTADTFLLGLPFGVITAPCTAPIIVAVLSLIAANGSVLFGLLVLLTFAVGRSVPLVLGAGYGHRVIARLGSGKSATVLKRGLGVILVVASLYFLTAGRTYLGA
jgi:cytochrome c-type biogenesis protein